MQATQKSTIATYMYVATDAYVLHEPNIRNQEANTLPA